MPRYNDYDKECGSCEYFFQCRGNWDIPYDVNDTDRGYCSYPTHRSTYYPDDSCGYYKKRGSYSGGCYITTIVCNILGFDDDCEVLNNLRHLRDNFMQKNDVFAKNLYQYDTVGPQISKIIYDDYNECGDDSIARALYSNYILPSSDKVKDNDYEGAIKTYQKMTNSLIEVYNIEPIDEISKDYNYQNGGHGYIKTREV